MSYSNLPEAKAGATEALDATDGAGEMVRILTAYIGRMTELEQYFTEKLHPLVNTNRSANLVTQASAARMSLKIARNHITTANAQIGTMVNTMEEFS